MQYVKRVLFTTQKWSLIRNFLIVNLCLYLLFLLLLNHNLHSPSSNHNEDTETVIIPSIVLKDNHAAVGVDNIGRSTKMDDETTQCVFQQRSLDFLDTGYTFMFDVFRNKEEEAVIILAPDVRVKKKEHKLVDIPPKIEVEFVKYSNDDTSLDSKILLRELGSCSEEYETYSYFSKTRFHIGTVAPFIYRCVIPKQFSEKFRTFHVNIFNTKPTLPHYVQDCVDKKSDEKELRFSNVVVTENSIEEVSYWLKFMHFIGFDRVGLWIDNPTSERLAFYLHNFDPSFLEVRPRVSKSKSYRPFQTLALADSFLRKPTDWAMTNDVDEYPVFFPNMRQYAKDFEKENPDVAVIEVPVLMYSNKKEGSGSYLETMEEWSPILRVTYPCDKGTQSIFEDRPKPLFKPDRITNVENHYACPKEKFRVYQSEPSKGFFSHFYGHDGRELPDHFPLRYDVSSRKDEEGMWGTILRPCFYEAIDKSRSSSIGAILKRYDEILRSCDGFLCEKNEIEMQDEELVKLKKDFQIVTSKKLKKGYTHDEVTRYHDTIVHNCRIRRS